MFHISDCIWFCQSHKQSLILFAFQIFVWIGRDANEVERAESLKSGKMDSTYKNDRKLNGYFSVSFSSYLQIAYQK